MFLHEQAEKIRKELDEKHLDPIVIMPLVLILLTIVVAMYDSRAVSSTLAMIVALSPLWLPFFIGTALFLAWIHYVRYKYWFSRDFGLLEIQLPAEVTKSPAAMEVFLASFWTTGGETTFIDRLFKGGVKSTWTLEIASNEGRISFYMYTLKVWHPAVEARIYGQFPDAKVTAVDDYVPKVPFNLEDYDIWGGEYVKGSPQASPIRTYIDFELDKNADTPETKVDPITNILELMNNVGPGQYLWYQMIMRAHNVFDWYGFQDSKDDYKEEANKKIRELMAGAAKRAQTVLKESDIIDGKMNALLTDGEKKIIEGIEHSLTKNPFEVGIRVVYIAEKDKFHGVWGAYLFSLFRITKGPGNSLGGKPGSGLIRFDFPWEDFMGIRERHIKKQLHFHYKNRAYFSVPYDQAPSIMTTEEVATLWHFPNSNVKTPGLNRVPSKSSDAPTNLPTLPQ